MFEKVANAYGIQLVFDAAYVLPSPSTTLHITDATAQEALRTLEAATDSFLIPLGEHLAMVGRDTAQKRTELMPVIAVAAPIPERLSAQEAQEIATAVQQTLEIRRISLDSAKRVVYFRDTVPKGLAARRMFADLSRGRAQIEVDVEFVSVGRNFQSELWPAIAQCGRDHRFRQVLSEHTFGRDEWLFHLRRRVDAVGIGHRQRRGLRDAEQILDARRC